MDFLACPWASFGRKNHAHRSTCYYRRGCGRLFRSGFRASSHLRRLMGGRRKAGGSARWTAHNLCPKVHDRQGQGRRRAASAEGHARASERCQDFRRLPDSRRSTDRTGRNAQGIHQELHGGETKLIPSVPAPAVVVDKACSAGAGPSRRPVSARSVALTGEHKEYSIRILYLFRDAFQERRRPLDDSFKDCHEFFRPARDLRD
jgi:hypothetical protein